MDRKTETERQRQKDRETEGQRNRRTGTERQKQRNLPLLMVFLKDIDQRVGNGKHTMSSEQLSKIKYFSFYLFVICQYV